MLRMREKDLTTHPHRDSRWDVDEFESMIGPIIGVTRHQTPKQGREKAKC